MRLFLPVRPDLDDAVGALDLDERRVRPAEAVARRLHAEARARPAPDRVDPRQVPVDHEVIGELAVVGDVLQVVEHLLARRRDNGRDGQWVHGARQSKARGAPDRRRAAQAARAVEADRVTVLAVAHDLARDGRLAAQRAAQLADDAAVAAVVEVHVLAGQRRAPAVDAALAPGLQSAHTASQQEALELLCVVGRSRPSGRFFRRRDGPSCRPGAVASCWRRDPGLVVCPQNAAG